MSISGKFLVCRIGGVILSGVQDWEVEDAADELDGTTGEDEGYDNPDDGVAKATITMNLVLETDSGSYARVKRGTLIEDLMLYEHIDDAVPAYEFPLAKVFTSRRRAEVKGRKTAAITAKSKGPFTVN